MDEDKGPGAARRQVTVLFCDLAGSTELANTVDPEDMAEIFRAYRDACDSAIARYEGLLARYMGDGVLAYFGYPQAHEEDAERSVRAALAIVDGVSELRRPDGRGLEVRVGIATGVVVIGDVIGSGIAREHAIVGETPNLAARLQALAEPNAILLSQGTRNLLGKHFEVLELGERVLKGFAKPVPVWRVLGEAAVESRFAARPAPRAVPFVGRAPQLDTLLGRWTAARRAEGQAVLVSGDAGIGKSRVVDAFGERIANDPHYRVFCQCSPYHANSVLHPVIGYLERAAQFSPGDSPAAKLDKLEALLSATGPPPALALSLLADLLSLPPEGRYAPLELLPVQRKAATITALVEGVIRLSRHQPVLFVLEDAHWVDPSTREVVARLIESARFAPVLAIITTRPEAGSAEPWGDSMETLALARLNHPECVEMVGAISRGRGLDAATVEDIVSKTDGVPLFVEELTKSVLESGTSRAATVPPTLQDSLMGRLDRLGRAKDIAQVAAVIGHRFSFALLEAVAVVPPEELARAVERLVESGLVLRHDDAQGASGRFKHALLGDVAYGSLLRSRRQQLHERVALAIEGRFPAMALVEPEVVAHHFSRASMPEPACAYCERAGDRAAERSAYAEAVAHFRAGLVEAQCLASSPARSRRELTLLLKLCPALSLMKGPLHPEIQDLYRRAQAIAKSLDDEAGYFKATWGLWFTAHGNRDGEAALVRAEELVALGRESTDSDLLLEAIHCRWSTSYARGDVTTALADGKEGIERYDPARHKWMGAVFGGHDPGVCAYGVRANSLALAALPELAREGVDQALALAESLGHPPSLSQTFQSAMLAYQMVGDPAAVRRTVRRMLALADRYDFTTQRTHARFMDGWAIAAGEDLEAGLVAMESQYPAASLGVYCRYYAALMAEAQLRAGRIDDAQSVVLSVLATVTVPGHGFYVPELYRLHGECLFLRDAGNAGDAARSIQMAVDTARERGARLLELKALASLERVRFGANAPQPLSASPPAPPIAQAAS